jgi:hypothetical protein
LGAASDVEVARRWFDAPAGIAVQWFGILAGPAAWFVDQQISYSIVQWVCGGGPHVVLHLISLASLLVAGAGAFASWTVLQRTRPSAAEDGSQPDERGRFMAILGLVSCAFFALVIVAMAVPRVVLDACQQ